MLALDVFVTALPVVRADADAGAGAGADGGLSLPVGGPTTSPADPDTVGSAAPVKAEAADDDAVEDDCREARDTATPVGRAPVDNALGVAAVNVVGPATVEVQAASETRATAPRMHERFCDMKSPERWQRQTANDTGGGSFQE